MEERPLMVSGRKITDRIRDTGEHLRNNIQRVRRVLEENLCWRMGQKD